MLIDITQKSPDLERSIRDYGCLFLCFAQQSPLKFEGEEGCKALNYLWNHAMDKGVISKDNILLDHTRLARDFFALDIYYDDIHHDADEEIPEDVVFVIGKFVWKYGHFVLINRKKEVIFDSLINSYSVQNGELESMRFYYAEKKSINL